MDIFDYSVIMLHFPPSDIKKMCYGPHSLSPKENKHCKNIQPVVTLYKLHPESVPSDIVGILEMFNWQLNAHQSLWQFCPSPLTTNTIGNNVAISTA